MRHRDADRRYMYVPSLSREDLLFNVISDTYVFCALATSAFSIGITSRISEVIVKWGASVKGI